MNVEKKPYELLIRWGQDGSLQGAHVRWRFIVSDGGAVLSESVSDAEPVAIAGQSGFPIAEALGDISQTSLLALGEAELRLADLSARLAASEAAVQAAAERYERLEQSVSLPG